MWRCAARMIQLHPYENLCELSTVSIGLLAEMYFPLPKSWTPRHTRQVIRYRLVQFLLYHPGHTHLSFRSGVAPTARRPCRVSFAYICYLLMMLHDYYRTVMNWAAHFWASLLPSRSSRVPLLADLCLIISLLFYYLQLDGTDRMFKGW